MIAPYTLAMVRARIYITGMAVNPETTTRKLVSLSHKLVAEIEDFRFANRIKTESEAIRRLIESGLRSTSKDGKRR